MENGKNICYNILMVVCELNTINWYEVRQHEANFIFGGNTNG